MSPVIIAIAGPREAAALFRLELLDSHEVVALAERWLMDELDGGSADVAWIASQSHPIMSELQQPFEQAVLALTGPLPTGDDAVRTAVRLYARAIADGSVDAQGGMDALAQDLEHKFANWPQAIIRSPDKKIGDHTNYAGSNIGAEYLYTWYRQLQDAENGSDLFYYNDLPRHLQLEKFREELRSAAARLADHLERIDGARSTSDRSTP